VDRLVSATAVMLVFAFAGQSLLNYLISTGSLRVAGTASALNSLTHARGELDTPVVEQERDVAILHWRCLCWLDQEH